MDCADLGVFDHELHQHSLVNAATGDGGGEALADVLRGLSRLCSFARQATWVTNGWFLRVVMCAVAWEYAVSSGRHEDLACRRLREAA